MACAQQRQQQRAAEPLHVAGRGGDSREYGVERILFVPICDFALFFVAVNRDGRPINAKVADVGGRAQGEVGGDDECSILSGNVCVAKKRGRERRGPMGEGG